MKAIAIYLRLSGEDGNASESDSIANQRELITHYIRSRSEFDDYTILEFCDDGWSGASFNRPAFNKMIALLGESLEILVVKDFSRFGRNLIEVGNYIDQVFPFLGVRFIAINENYDSNTHKGSTASIDVGLKALVYEMYSRDTSQKIRAVQRLKLSNGEYLGNMPPYGYMRSQTMKNKLIANPDTAPVVRYIYKLAAEKKTPREITKILNKEGILSPRMYHKSQGTHTMRGWRNVNEDTIWIIYTVRKILYDERYTGIQISGKTTKIDVSTRKQKKIPQEEWIICENAHEPIVTKEEWDAAQVIFNKKGSVGNRTMTKRNILKGLVKCSECGHTLGLYKDQKVPCYRCNRHKFIEDCSCKDMRIIEKDLLESLLSYLQSQIKLIDSNETKEKPKQKQNFFSKLTELDEETKKIEVQKTTLFEKFANAKVSKDSYKQKYQNLNAKADEIERTREEIMKTYNESFVEQASLVSLSKYSEIKELTQDLAKELIQNIVAYPDNRIEVTWKFKT